MLATVLEWLSEILTGAIMESRKAARSKAVASPPPGTGDSHSAETSETDSGHGRGTSNERMKSNYCP